MTVEARSSLAEADDAVLAGPLRALGDLLDPMANRCSGGRPKTIGKTQVHEILSGGEAR